MNYYTENNTEIRNAVAALLKCDESSIGRVTFAVSYPHNNRASVVTIEASPESTIRGLFFIYNQDEELCDVLSCRDKVFFRVNGSSENLRCIDRINHLLLKVESDVNPLTPRAMVEDSDGQDNKEKIDTQIQQLKDKNRIERERNRSEKAVSQGLRNQLKALRARKS